MTGKKMLLKKKKEEILLVTNIFSFSHTDLFYKVGIEWYRANNLEDETPSKTLRGKEKMLVTSILSTDFNIFKGKFNHMIDST